MTTTPPPPYQAIAVQPRSASGKLYNPPNANTSAAVSYPVTTQPSVIPIPEPCAPVNDVEKLYRRIGNRIIYDFEKVSCYPGQHNGLDFGVESQVPKEMADKGISLHQWAEWVSELQEIQRKAPTVCGCLLMFCFPGFLVQSILCAMFCPISMAHPFKFLPCCYGDWYDGLDKWMSKVNTVLNRKEMHAKLMTYKPYSGAPKSRNYGTRTAGKDPGNYEMSFLVIALNKQESLKLQSESWDHGVNDRCTSGIGRIL